MVGFKFYLMSVLVIAPMVAPPCQAGTGGIFPFSNRRKLQQTTLIESPTALPQSPRVKSRVVVPSFPSTPGTMPDESRARKRSAKQLPLKGLESSDVRTINAEQHRSVDQPGNVDQQGSVESFFQINAPQVYRPTNTPDAKSVRHLDTELDSPGSASSKSAVGAPFRFMWHVMDNAGVPMFFGKKDDDLDPSLRRNFQTSVTPAPMMKPTATEYGAANKIPHKIPESELEGTSHWVNIDDEMP